MGLPSGSQVSVDSPYTSLKIGLELMLPKAEDCNAVHFELAGYLPISLAIIVKFGLPERVVVVGDVSTSQTSVPKASVNKDRRPRWSEEEIRITYHALGINFPASNTALD
jgi:hypothetical protein